MSQSTSRSKSALMGFVAGIGLTGLVAVMMGQSANQPVKSEPQFFVTADGEGAHLWVREGTALRVIGHGECAECLAEGHDGHDHKEGDDHGHSDPASK